MENAIEIRNLNKTYKKSKRHPEKVALENIDLNIPKGSIFALLGPNGAGKSTIINIMAGLVTKTSGNVKIWGFDIDKNERNAKRNIGIVPQEINFDPYFTPLQSLELQAGLYGIPKSERRSEDILNTVGLYDKKDSYVRSLSGGMKRRLLMAKAMVHNPPILVLDEPTAGVDIELRKQLWKNVKALNDKGVTIVLTTHYLEEAEELCDKVAIINHGKIVACEDKTTLLSGLDSKDIILTLEKDITTLPEKIAQYDVEIKNQKQICIQYKSDDGNIGEITNIFHDEGYNITDITTYQSDLEDIFLQLTAS